MNFNICLVQPKNYVHSAAFAELGEVVGYGLQDLGHSVALSINQTYIDATNIIIGCHLLDPVFIKQTPKNSVVLNTEQIYNDETKWNSKIFEWANSFTTWDYSERNVAKLNEVGAKKPRRLRIGYHKNLKRIPKNEKQDIDVLFYGSIGDRRKAVIEQMKTMGINIQAVFGVYGEARDQLISRAKIVLNMHHYNSKIFEIVRAFYLMSNSKAIVTEVDVDTSIDDIYKPAIASSPYNLLGQKCQQLIENEDERLLLEQKAFQVISELPQSEFLKPLLCDL